MGRNLHHLVRTDSMLSERGVGLKVLTGQGTLIDTTTAAGRFSFGIFAALAEFERELIRERTIAGLKSARARGRKGGRKFAFTKAQVRMAQAAMVGRDTSVSECQSAFNDDPLSSSNRDPPPEGGQGGSRRRRASPRAGPAAAATPLSCEILPGGWRRH